MKKILSVLIVSLFLISNSLANTMRNYLNDGYKLHSVTNSSDGTALFYHLIKNQKKENTIIVTCIVNAVTGKTVKCYNL
jgi:hypothetical protein